MAASQGLDFLAILFAINAALILTTATVLLACLPPRVQILLQQQHRQFDCWIGLAVVCAIVLLPTNVVIVFVHERIIPIPLAYRGVEAMTRPGAGGAAHSDDLYDVAHEFEAHHVGSGGTLESARESVEAVWNGWPWIVLGFMLSALVGVMALSRFYKELAHDLERVPIGSRWDRLLDEIYGDAPMGKDAATASHHRERYGHRRGRRHRHRSGGDLGPPP